jgi:hypothetical protein
MDSGTASGTALDQTRQRMKVQNHGPKSLTLCGDDIWLVFAIYIFCPV